MRFANQIPFPLLMLSSLTVIFGQSTRNPATAAPDIPAVTMDYSSLFDNTCSESMNRPLDSKLVARVTAKLPEYRAQWTARGPALLRAEIGAVGQPFVYHETMAAIVTCGVTSMSFPLMLNARMFQAAHDAAGSDAEEMTVFVNTLWHEASHRYVHDIRDRLPGRMTPLLDKYPGEPQTVINHLHLYAIEEVVYRQLGLQQDLDFIRTFQQKARNAEITRRAREIVAKEGADAFVRELKTAPRPH